MTQEASLVKKFVKDFLKYSPSSIIPSIIGFLIIPFLTNLFPPGEYGNYIILMSTVNFLGTIINSLWGTPIVRFFIVFKKEGKLRQYYDTLIGSYSISLFLIILAFILFLVMLKGDMDPFLYNLMILGIPLLILTGFFSIMRRLLNAKEKSGLYSLFTVIQSMIAFIFGIYIILVFKTDIKGFIWGYILSYLVLIPFMYYVSFEGLYLGKHFEKSTFFNFLNFGLPLLISSLSGWILSISDRYILNFFRGSFEVGIYSASYSLSEYALTIIWTLFMTSSYPLIVKIWETQGHNQTQIYIKKLTRYFLIIGFPAAAGLSILSENIISIITSPSYYEGYIIVPLISFGAFLLGLQWWAQLGVILNNKTLQTAKMVVIAGVSNIILNFILIPYYGFFGAAISTFFSYLILLLLCIKISNKYLKWEFPFNSFIKIILASIVMGAILYLTMNILKVSIVSLISEIVMGVLVYLISLYLIGEVKNEEIALIKNYIQKFSTFFYNKR